MEKVSTIQDQEMVNRLNKQDPKAYSVLFTRYYSVLCYYVENKLRDKEAAQDIVSDLFTRIWDRGEQFQSPEHLRGFLYRSAHNALLNHVKMNNRATQREQSVYEDQEAYEQQHLHAMIRAEVLRELNEAIAKLPGQQGQVISLAFMEGLDNHQVAKVLGISEKTVRNLKSEALSRLRQDLRKESFEWLLALPFLLPFSLQAVS